MHLKRREDFQIPPILDNLIDDDLVVVFGIVLFIFNMKKKMFSVLESFQSFFKYYDKRKPNSMLSLMLNLRFKSLRLVSSFIGHEQVVVIIEGYDRKYIYFILLKCYHHLNLVAKFEGDITNQGIDEDYNMDFCNKLLAQENQQKNLSASNC
jgi:hypothetical protein